MQFDGMAEPKYGSMNFFRRLSFLNEFLSLLYEKKEYFMELIQTGQQENNLAQIVSATRQGVFVQAYISRAEEDRKSILTPLIIVSVIVGIVLILAIVLIVRLVKNRRAASVYAL